MRTHRRFISIWLFCLCGLIVGMIVIGGITRLTGSGLSIVDWNPLMGAIPPLTEASWQEVFEKYRQFPQYKLINAGMTLHDFKFIFFWEYFHRLVGRLMGVVLIGPLVWLMAVRAIDRALAMRIFGAFFLGGLQGALGWFMVKSGLVDKPQVSHYRLAAHLILAFIVLAYVFNIALDVISSRPGPAKPILGVSRIIVRILLPLVMVQVVYGAFVAGLHAGHAYNTFPTMNGEWIPSGALGLTPFWLNFFENAATVQFVHRCLAWLIVSWVMVFTVKAWKCPLSSSARASTVTLGAATIGQFVLGIVTLLLGDPVALASLHQFGATLLFLAALWANHEFNGPKEAKSRLLHRKSEVSRAGRATPPCR